MKKALITILAICFIFVVGCEEEPKESIVVTNAEAEEITVYITRTGECYHTEDCVCLSKSKIERDLGTAVRNYRACQVCFPPVIEE